MGLGGSHSHNKGNSNNNGGSRGRPYGVMLLLAFGAALLGVMVLHKLRERRIFNLLLKDRDNELISIHLLLQKERDRVQEVNRKNEDMKANIYTLRNQKMEVDRRLIEMQSTIDSLKDEQRTMEVAIEEKQNEIRMLRLKESATTETENTQVTELIETLKQKDAEIEDLKKRLQNPVKMSSDDDPSNPSVNLTTVTGNTVGKEKTAEGDGKIIVTDQKSKNSQDQRIEDGGSMGEKQGQGKKSEGFKDGSEENNIAASETISDGGGKDIEENGELGRLENAQGEGQEHVENSNGGMKLDRQENSNNNVWPMKRGKHGSFSNTKGRRWRLIAKNRRFENRNFKNNGVTGMRTRKFFEDDQGRLKGRTKAAPFRGGLTTGDDNRHVGVAEVVNSGAAKDQDATDGQQSRDINREATKKNEASEHLDNDFKEPGNHADDDKGDGNFSSKSGSTSEQDEEYKDEIDDTEF
ncbi:hypothetical protein FEM48_Zijuj04G0074700 [Ziziphus jujuba var. spinosa]|uniref:Uncharacterized protein n=1 Tax=Ziziphus jujuba var. spinosa TaxID=714518 RepID=A0A978VIK9_ZIZJJ|nr:hypothetical protein FEM48_Zijuj04G0074700 [Ziziphus jujuba var. spinosa]